MIEQQRYNTGLAGIIVGETAISTVGEDNVGLSYRGYSIDDLAKFSSFEEVCFLLLYKILPNKKELGEFCLRLQKRSVLPEKLQIILKELPGNTHPMNVLRTGISVLGCLEPESPHNNQFHISERLIAILPAVLFYWYHYHQTGKEIDTMNFCNSISDYFLSLMTGNVPDGIFQKIMTKSFILYAEHKFNASTFSARVTTSTLSDFYSSIISAIGTLAGKLHGGANEKSMDLIDSFSNTQDVAIKIKQKLQNKQLIMGFGHRVYKTFDPRTAIMKKCAESLASELNDERYFPIAEEIERVMKQEKNLFPNLDFYSAIVFHLMGINNNFYTPLFVCSRVSGWCAHVLEQREHNKLIRPNAKYIGPELKQWSPMEHRKISDIK